MLYLCLCSTFILPEDAVPDGIAARMDHGVLTVDM
jgi:HSP20 family molecular chaperone IbpA